MPKRKLKRYKIPEVEFHDIVRVAVMEKERDKATQRPRRIFFLAQREKREKDDKIYLVHNKWAVV